MSQLASRSPAALLAAASPVAAIWRRYAPFIIASGLVIVLTTAYSVIRSRHQSVGYTDVMNYFMGFYFVVYAAPKFFGLRAFAKALASYDLVAARFPAYGLAYPFIELTFGLLYLSQAAMAGLAPALIVNSLVMLFSALNAAGILQALRTREPLACGCLGSSFKLPLSKLTLAENCLMFLMAAVMLVTFKSMVM